MSTRKKSRRSNWGDRFPEQIAAGHAELAEMFRAMHAEPDRSARARLRERLISGHLAYLRWAVKWSVRAMRRSVRVPIDIQEMWAHASMILCVCVDKFDPDNGASFRGYLKICVLRGLAAHAYNDEQLVHVSDYSRQNALKWRKANKATGVTAEEYAAGLSCRAGRGMLAVLAHSERESRGFGSMEAQFDPSLIRKSRDYDLVDCRDLAESAMDVLTPEERELLLSLYWEGRNLGVVAREKGVLHNTLHYRRNAIFARIRRLWPELVA
jgi:DNA-directed RNA polymerase specialized sigma subunit